MAEPGIIEREVNGHVRSYLDPAPLLQAVRYSKGDLGARAAADRLGVSQRQLVRWLGGSGVSRPLADRCAIRIGRHPAELWGAAWDYGTDEDWPDDDTYEDMKEEPMSEATVTPLSPTHRCDECGQSFAKPAGLAIHKGRTHSTREKRPTAHKAAVEHSKPAVAAIPEREVLKVLAAAYHALNGAEVDVAIDSAAALIDAMAERGWNVTAA